jgi:hypothetical protein
MAIKLIQDFDNNLLTAKVTGNLSGEDYELLEPGDFWTW